MNRWTDGHRSAATSNGFYRLRFHRFNTAVIYLTLPSGSGIPQPVLASIGKDAGSSGGAWLRQVQPLLENCADRFVREGLADTRGQAMPMVIEMAKGVCGTVEFAKPCILYAEDDSAAFMIPANIIHPWSMRRFVHDQTGNV